MSHATCSHESTTTARRNCRRNKQMAPATMTLELAYELADKLNDGGLLAGERLFKKYGSPASVYQNGTLGVQVYAKNGRSVTRYFKLGTPAPSVSWKLA